MSHCWGETLRVEVDQLLHAKFQTIHAGLEVMGPTQATVVSTDQAEIYHGRSHPGFSFALAPCTEYNGVKNLPKFKILARSICWRCDIGLYNVETEK